MSDIYFYNKKLKKKKKDKDKICFSYKKLFTLMIFIIIYHLSVKLHKHPLYHLKSFIFYKSSYGKELCHFHPQF